MKRIFSGVQPSGEIHLGNYITMKNFKNHQLDKDCFYCIVDLHAITVEQDREELKRKSIELAALYIAIGLDPEKVTVFIQSQVSELYIRWRFRCGQNKYLPRYHQHLHWLCCCSQALRQQSGQYGYKCSVCRS